MESICKAWRSSGLQPQANMRHDRYLRHQCERVIGSNPMALSEILIEKFKKNFKHQKGEWIQRIQRAKQLVWNKIS